jgi:serine/threonine protein kinase
VSADDQARESFIKIIEAQQPLDGRYSNIQRITDTAGNGHFSLLFKAYDIQMKRSVAVKVFNPSRAADVYRQRAFERESRILEEIDGADNLLELIAPRTVFEHIFEDTVTGLKLPIQFPYFVVALARCSFKDYIHSAEREVAALFWTKNRAALSG